MWFSNCILLGLLGLIFTGLSVWVGLDYRPDTGVYTFSVGSPQEVSNAGNMSNCVASTALGYHSIAPSSDAEHKSSSLLNRYHLSSCDVAMSPPNACTSGFSGSWSPLGSGAPDASLSSFVDKKQLLSSPEKPVSAIDGGTCSSSEIRHCDELLQVCLPSNESLELGNQDEMPRMYLVSLHILLIDMVPVIHISLVLGNAQYSSFATFSLLIEIILLFDSKNHILPVLWLLAFHTGVTVFIHSPSFIK